MIYVFKVGDRVEYLRPVSFQEAQEATARFGYLLGNYWDFALEVVNAIDALAAAVE